MKIYTKKGDEGQTSLLGGKLLPKSDLRIESYGTVDELNSYIGLTRDLIGDEHKRSALLEIQDRLFTIGSALASDPSKSNLKTPDLLPSDVTFLENKIDEMEEALPEMKSFILPGGHPAVSTCHVARCVCRRAERHVVLLASQEKVDKQIIQYLNRLSDYLFVLARAVARDLNIRDIPWKPRM